MKNTELLYNAMSICNNDAKDLINRFLLSNMGKDRHRLNLYDFVSKDKYRPALTGVFHENGFRVATNSHILVSVKENYPNNYEGKIFNDKFVEIEAQYPKYKSVIPDKNNMREFPFKLNDVKALYRQYVLDKRADKTVVGVIYFDNVAISMELIKGILDFANTFNVDKLYLSSPDRCIYMESGENKLIAMPTFVNESRVELKIYK